MMQKGVPEPAPLSCIRQFEYNKISIHGNRSTDF